MSIDILPEQRVLLMKVLEAIGVIATEERMTIAIFEFIAVPMAQFSGSNDSISELCSGLRFLCGSSGSHY